MRSMVVAPSTSDLIAQSEAARLNGIADQADALLLAAWLSYDETIEIDIDFVNHESVSPANLAA